jgi:general secretion pathway protein H
MPTLATGISNSEPVVTPRRRSRGFTLLELLVVVFIIGLVSAATLITMRTESRDTELEHEADQIDALFDYVREQAELQSREYGFRVTAEAYSFVVFDSLGNEWREVDEDDILRSREFPEGILPEVVVEGRQVVLDKPRKAEDFLPQIMIYSNGDLSSFEIILRRKENYDNEPARIYSDENSRIVLEKPSDPRDAAGRRMTVRR